MVDRVGTLLTFAIIVAIASMTTTIWAGAQRGPSACNAPSLPLRGARIVSVSSEPELQRAVASARAGDTILLARGTYALTNTLNLDGKHDVTIRGYAGCDDVVLRGRGMDNRDHGNIRHGIWSNSRKTTIAHLTIRDTYDNLVIFNPGAQSPHLYSVRLLNAGSQFIKVNPTDAVRGIGVDNGVVEYCWLEYPTGPPSTDHGVGIGYTNGISAHAATGWIIRKNVFKNFHTPDSSAYPWNPAVLIWNHSANTVTEQNLFFNVDRAVAYGLTPRGTWHDHEGGTIRNNFVYMAPGLFSATRKRSSDGQIIVWDSPNTRVYHNTILTNGNSASAIEFRFPGTTGAEVRNNLADARINFRDGATAVQVGNVVTATPDMFVDPAAGDLHLLGTATAAIDKAPPLPVVVEDFDGDPRPQGGGYDVGADEFLPMIPVPHGQAGDTDEAVGPGRLSINTRRMATEKGERRPAWPRGYEIVQILGSAGDGPAQFRGPFGVRIAPTGEVYVADDLAHRITVFDASGRLLHTWGRHGSGPGELAWIDAVAVAPSGDIYIADTGNNRIQVWDRTGTFLREFSRSTLRGSGLHNPRDVVLGRDGLVYVADFRGDRVQVLNQEGAIVRTIGRRGARPGELAGPIQLAVSTSGLLYVSELHNHRIQVFTASGTPVRSVGKAGSAPGELASPHGVALGPDGLLYVADHGNHRVQVFAPDGTFVAVLSRVGELSADLRQPTGIAFSPDGRLFVVDKGNQRVQVWRLVRQEPS